LRKYSVKIASIFGSAVRGEMKEDIDADTFGEITNISLQDFIAVKLEP